MSTQFWETPEWPKKRKSLWMVGGRLRNVSESKKVCIQQRMDPLFPNRRPLPP
jgi:hypothetical protein